MGRSGRGGMFSGPPLAGSAVVQADDPASLINIILYGSDTPHGVSLRELGDDASLCRSPRRRADRGGQQFPARQLGQPGRRRERRERARPALRNYFFGTR